MGVPASREQLKTWCLRQLGFPVLDINVDDDQVDDRIDEAFQYFREFHYDGTEKTHAKHQITSTDVTNKYITVSDSVIGVTRIFPLNTSHNIGNMFDVNYQIMLNDMPTLTSTSPVSYVLTQQHLSLLQMLFQGEAPIRFNRHTDKLYIDWDWANDAVVGQWIIIEGYTVVDPDAYTQVYNDRMLKKLCTAYIKKQWGTNLKKFSGMQLPGGIQMNGQIIHDEAVAEIKEIEEEIRLTFEEPPIFWVG